MKVKKFKNFLNESNMGKGLGGDTSLFNPMPTPKQTLNKPNQTLDLLRIGKQIKTENIDGFIDSVQNENVMISDRMTGIIKAYSLKEFFKEFSKSDKKRKKINEKIESISTDDIIDDDDDEENMEGDVLGDSSLKDRDDSLTTEDFYYGDDKKNLILDTTEEEEEEEEDEDEGYDDKKISYISARRFRGTEDNPDGKPSELS
jgi:hypothetical protein